MAEVKAWCLEAGAKAWWLVADDKAWSLEAGVEGLVPGTQHKATGPNRARGGPLQGSQGP